MKLKVFYCRITHKLRNLIEVELILANHETFRSICLDFDRSEK